jgi:hypothetical protein
MTIKSVNYDQHEIIIDIMRLCRINRFDVDLTYGNGKFYTGIQEPVFKFDISPQVDGVVAADSCNVPLPDNSVTSVMFDPPFLTYVRAAREGNGNMVMAKRFGGYWKYDELEQHYKGTLVEAVRVLKKKGIMVFKCQDIIHNHKMHCTHVNVINWAAEAGLRLKDLFILPVKHRMPIPEQEGVAKKQQKHARIYHSYFLVFEK